MRVLVVRLGALGDIVHAVPAVAALAASASRPAIDWAVERRHREVLELFELPVRPVEVDLRRLAGLRELRRQRYDAAVDLQGLLKSAIVAWLSGARRVIGFSRRALREPAAARLYTETVDPGEHGHVIRKNLALVRALGADETAIRVPVKSGGEVPHRSGHPFVLLNPGAGWPNKRWPPERFGTLAARIERAHGYPSLVLWGPGERGLAEAVAAASAGAAEPAPPTTLPDLMRLLRGAAVLVSGDTGPLHLAAAAGTPIVGVYGPTDPARNGSWRDDDIALSRFEACRCHHKRRCTAPAWCLEAITVDEVAAAVEQRLKVAGARRG